MKKYSDLDISKDTYSEQDSDKSSNHTVTSANKNKRHRTVQDGSKDINFNDQYNPLSNDNNGDNPASIK